MHVTRSRMVRQLRAQDRYGRFRILYPVTDSDQPIYVHAKIMIVDDVLLRIGSSNIDRRSMGFDTECDVAIGAPDDETRAVIRSFRDELLAEHLGLPTARVAEEIERRAAWSQPWRRCAARKDAACVPCPRAGKPGWAAPWPGRAFSIPVIAAARRRAWASPRATC